MASEPEPESNADDQDPPLPKEEDVSPPDMPAS